MAELNLNDNKSENAMDIFLFSNGEENSPPRKYHLELKEISMWKGTLRNLGYSQYGLNDTDIDIYTTDGRKIEGPSQLNHLTAYVAVIPPCAFIQAGYDNYLIKATRSWEKRLLKSSNSVESATKDHTQIILPKLEFNVKFNENKALKQNEEIYETKRNNVIKAKRTIVKPDLVKTKKIIESKKVLKRPLTSNETKKTSFTPETTTLKTQMFTPFKISSAAKRSVIKTKESLQKKPLQGKKMFITNKKMDELKAASATITSLNVLESKLENRFTSKDASSSKAKQTQGIEGKNSLINEEKVISNIYKNTENEVLSISEVKCDETLNENFNDGLDNEAVSMPDNLCLNTSPGCIKRNSSKMSLIDNENKKIVHLCNIEPHSTLGKEPDLDFEQRSSVITSQNCSSKQKTFDNFINVVNNDKTFKLQLNLEIKNCDFSLNNGHNNIRESQSIKTIMREEKETQVNINEQLNKDNVVHCSFPKSDGVKNALNDKGKIIIIHCSCCDNVDLNNFLNSNILCNQNQNAPDLVSGFEQESIRCECGTLNVEENIHVTEFIDMPNFKHSLTSVEKNVSITSVHKLTSSKTELVKCASTMNSGKREYTQPSSEDNKLQMVISRHTQTSWCNTLLQAALHEDGKYSFHLPPLKTIKKYTNE